MTENKADIVKRIKGLRTTLNMGSGDFARSVGIDPRNYSSIETGKRTIGDRVIRDISNAYEVNYLWLLTGEGEMLKPEFEDVPTPEDSGSLARAIEIMAETNKILAESNIILAKNNTELVKQLSVKRAVGEDAGVADVG